VTIQVDDATLRTLVDGAGDAIVVTDRDGVVRYWNSGAELIFGWSRDEALGKSLDLMIPERLRGRHWAGWDHVMQTGVTRYGRELLAVPAVRKDGSPLSVEFTIQLLRDGSGAIVAVGAVLRDVTARFNKDKELRARVRDLEAKLKPPV
jgi:PAS domain S-box-containing protein